MGGVYQVYILQNAKGKYYIGLSENVPTRLQQHNQCVSNWTRSRGPWTLLWASQGLSLTEALKLEKYLKRQKGGTGFFMATGLSKRSSS